MLLMAIIWCLKLVISLLLLATDTKDDKITLSQCKKDDKIEIRKVLVTAAEIEANRGEYPDKRPEVLNRKCFLERKSVSIMIPV